MKITWGPPPRPERVPAEGYAYVCDDRSVLRPWLMRFVVTPLAEATPAWVSPSAITAIAFVLSLSPFLVGGAVAATSLVVYVALDHLDGVHARRIGAASVYGDYLDHWLDAWNSGLVPLGIALTWHAHGAVPLLLVIPATLAFTLTTIEHRATGVLRLDPLGATEAVVACGASYLVARSGLEGPVFLAVFLAPLAASLAIRRRLGGLPRDLLPLAAAVAAALVACARGADSVACALVVTTTAAITCGRIIRARIMAQDVHVDAQALTASAAAAALPALTPLAAAFLFYRAAADYVDMRRLSRA